ncbi:MAG: glucosamine-6-phosphate deaminase [Spirulinaceae cyanobacterium]
MAQVYKDNKLRVQQYNSAKELAKDAADNVRDYLQLLLEEKEQANVVLATGKSQLEFLDNLLTLGGLNWSKITCFHLDEYLGISANHQASFRHYLQEKVEKKVHPRSFYYLVGDALEPLKECERYSKLLQDQGIDLCCLGIGENGHLAFNDPSVANFNDPYWVKLVKLDQLNRQQQVNQGHFATLEAVPNYALTLTITAICTAAKIICLAPELRKAAVVKKMLLGDISIDCPASILRRQANATLFLDGNSASLLPEKIF